MSSLPEALQMAAEEVVLLEAESIKLKESLALAEEVAEVWEKRARTERADWKGRYQEQEEDLEYAEEQAELWEGRYYRENTALKTVIEDYNRIEAEVKETRGACWKGIDPARYKALLEELARKHGQLRKTEATVAALTKGYGILNKQYRELCNNITTLSENV